ncbi:MAG: hypothetical protein K6G73_00260 [Marinilabiliaceae bacterium]|nr:hypothetical protein [Marinilabiliaceae bacterium]
MQFQSAENLLSHFWFVDYSSAGCNNYAQSLCTAVCDF